MAWSLLFLMAPNILLIYPYQIKLNIYYIPSTSFEKFSNIQNQDAMTIFTISLVEHFAFLFLRHSDLTISALDLGRAVLVRALAGFLMLRPWAGHCTLTVPLSTRRI